VVSVYNDVGVLPLRRRFASEQSFSFISTDNIYTVANLLMLYLWDLPEPLIMLSLQDYRNYKQNRAQYTENDFSLLRSKIRELHPIHRASLSALMRHLLRVASHSDKNSMTVKVLADNFDHTVLRGKSVSQDGVHVKSLVMEDLIQNAHTLFDDRTPAPSRDVVEASTTFTYGSLFMSPELPHPAQVEGMNLDPTTRHRGIPTTDQSSFSSLPSDATTESRLRPSPTALLSPLLGLSASKTLTEGVEMTAQEQVIPEVRDTKAVKTLANSTPAEAVTGFPLTSVAEWRLQVPQSRLVVSPHPEAMTVPQSPSESVLSSASDFPLSSATSLQTRMGPFSP